MGECECVCVNGMEWIGMYTYRGENVSSHINGCLLLFSYGSSVKIDEIWNLNFDCTKVNPSDATTHDDHVDAVDDDLLGAVRIHFRKVAVTSHLNCIVK